MGPEHPQAYRSLNVLFNRPYRADHDLVVSKIDQIKDSVFPGSESLGSMMRAELDDMVATKLWRRWGPLSVVAACLSVPKASQVVIVSI